MYAGLSDLHPPEGGWTADHLDAMPEDDRRRELLDGALLLPPPPTNVHQVISARLMAALDDSCPAEHEATMAMELRLSRHRSFIPDGLVIPAAAAARNPTNFQPADVLLAVEVESESSTSMDRILKPALYAEAGIPFFWRVEAEPGLVVYAYRLDLRRDHYIPAGVFEATIQTEQPWPIEISLDRITPRQLRR